MLTLRASVLRMYALRMRTKEVKVCLKRTEVREPNFVEEMQNFFACCKFFQEGRGRPSCFVSPGDRPVRPLGPMALTQREESRICKKHLQHSFAT